MNRVVKCHEWIGRRCSEVPFPAYKEWIPIVPSMMAQGTLIWDFHGCEGHVLTERVLCSANSKHYCGACGNMIRPHKFWTCECGAIDWVDLHHMGIILALEDQ